MKSPFPFARHGASGLEISSLFPAHQPVCRRLVRGAQHVHRHGRACLRVPADEHGQRADRQAEHRILVELWIGDGQRESAFVRGDDRSARRPDQRRSNWTAGYMPAAYQGTLFRSTGAPLLDLTTPAGTSGATQRRALDLLASLNRRHAEAREGGRGAGGADSFLRTGISNADRGFRDGGPEQGKPADARDVRHPRQAHGGFRQEVSDHAAAAGARRALHSALLRRRPYRRHVGRPQ